MFTTDATTTETAILPWHRLQLTTDSKVPHLVTAWFMNEAERVGTVAAIDRPCCLGRASVERHTPDLLTFHEVRPGESLALPSAETNQVSRRQLELEPSASGLIAVKNVGKRKLFHNGVKVDQCVASPGDTLMIENTAVFLVEARPGSLPALADLGGQPFPFGRPDSHGIVGESLAIWQLRADLASIAASSHHVLIVGPSGAGKELAAQAVHRLSAEAAGPFIDRNAVTIPSGLVDAELFGSARNYPNPGLPERDGLIGAAHEGTLFLDEVGELDQTAQAHLLRVLDNAGAYQRLGESKPRRSNFRLVGATNRDPAQLKHDFRARFGAVLEVPGLGERRADIPFLIRELIRRMSEQRPALTAPFVEEGAPKIDPAFVELLLRHPYSLHTRELERVLSVAIRSSRGEYLEATPEVLACMREGPPSLSDPEDMSTLVDKVPLRQIHAALQRTDGNVSRAAEFLGVSRDTLRRLMKKHGL